MSSNVRGFIGAVLLTIGILLLLIEAVERSKPTVDVNAWRSVPANCAVEYDAQSRIVASYCR